MLVLVPLLQLVPSVTSARRVPGSGAADGAGEINFDKFCQVMESMGKHLETADLLRMFQEMDDDGGGTIDANEFAEWYVEEEELQKKNVKREVGADIGPSFSSQLRCRRTYSMPVWLKQLWLMLLPWQYLRAKTNAETKELTYSPRARQLPTKQDEDDIENDSVIKLSRRCARIDAVHKHAVFVAAIAYEVAWFLSGEQVNMDTLRADFIELDRLASKLQKDFERIMVTVNKKMAAREDE